MRPPRRTHCVIAALCAGLLAGCDAGRVDATGRGQQGGPPEVAVVTIQPRSVTLTADLPGRTVPYAVSDVRPQVGGILKARLFTEGSRVQAGQALYRIDDTPYQAAYDSVKAKLASARAALRTAKLRADRYESLRQKKSISQQDYDDAQAALQQAEADVSQQEADLEVARVNLGYTEIDAPISGKIGRSYLTQGALVTANQSQALATIQTLDPIYVDVKQSSSELLALKRAMETGRVSNEGTTPVTLTLDDGTAYSRKGILQFREVEVEPSTGTVTLRAQFPNPDEMLLPGMFVRATVVEGVEPNALVVPGRGVSRDERGNATALIVDDEGMVRRRELTTGRTIGSDWLVTDGISPGDRIIVEGLQHVRPGQPAKAVPFRPAEDDTGPTHAPGALPAPDGTTTAP